MGSALGNNYGKYYSFKSKPVDLDFSFKVDAANANGFGVSSVTGQGVRAVYMATSASFVGSTHTSTTIDTITSTANLVVGMVIAGSGIAAGTKIVSINSATAITVSIATTTSVSGGTITYVAVGSPMVNTGVSSTASIGYALINLKYSYTKLYAGPYQLLSPTTGSAVAINSTSLTVGQAYVIGAVGVAAKGAVTIAPVADSSGSLASTWFQLFDGYGQAFTLWFQVGGVGSAPVGTGGILVPVAVATNATAANITTALNSVITALQSSVAGTFSFTASGGGGATLTVTSTQTNPSGPLPGSPKDGAIPTGFTFATTVSNTNLKNWQAVGVPLGITPNVGVAFIATATGSSAGGGSTGTVLAVGVSGIISMEMIGNPNESIFPIPMGGTPHPGGWILVQFLAPTISGSAYDTPMIPTAPANNTTIWASLILEQGAEVGGNGE